MGTPDPQVAMQLAAVSAGQQPRGARHREVAPAPHGRLRRRGAFRVHPLTETGSVYSGTQERPGDDREIKRLARSGAGAEQHLEERGRRSGAVSTGALQPTDAVDEPGPEGRGARGEDVSGLHPVGHGRAIAGKRRRERHV